MFILFLLDDSFSIINTIDDHDRFDSKISMVLSPGVYFIEASYWSIGSAWDFELSISADQPTVSVFCYFEIE